MILGEDGQKMSKSRGNVVNPDDVVQKYGADTLRTYEMFMGDFEKTAPWNSSSIKGCKRFLDRVWALQSKVTGGDGYSDALRSPLHRLIKKVSQDIEELKFNTAIAAMMAFLNTVDEVGTINKAEYKTLLVLVNPVAPHITEEIFETVYGGFIRDEKWPEYDEKLCVDETVEIAITLNGKVRAKLSVGINDESDAVIAKAKELIADQIAGKQLVKELYVKGRLVNIVVK
jgi:leucyl-tRNA synthetase